MDDKLHEAKQIIRELTQALSSGLGCSTRDFLGTELCDRIDMCLYGCVEKEDSDEEEVRPCNRCVEKEDSDEEEVRPCNRCGVYYIPGSTICGCQK